MLRPKALHVRLLYTRSSLRFAVSCSASAGSDATANRQGRDYASPPRVVKEKFARGPPCRAVIEDELTDPLEREIGNVDIS
jgi:hypothetical protein